MAWGAMQSCCHSFAFLSSLLSNPACCCSYICMMRKVQLTAISPADTQVPLDIMIT